MVLEVELNHCQEIEILDGKIWNEMNTMVFKFDKLWLEEEIWHAPNTQHMPRTHINSLDWR
jgi:hypothetical protein